MKQKLLISLLFAIALNGFSQKALKIFKNVKEIKVRNMGAIKTDNQIKGYYTFYEYDKVDRKHLVYKLDLLDENLNNIGSKEIEGSMDLQLIGSGYDGKNFCFQFWNEITNTVELKVYDQEAKEVASIALKNNFAPKNDVIYMSYQELAIPELNVAENNGFVNYSFNSKKRSFFITYVEGSTKKSWNRPYDFEGKFKMMIPTFLNGDNEMMLTAVSRVRKGFYSSMTQNFVLASSTKDGQQIFDIPTDFDDNHIVPINAVFDKDKITIIGLNYISAKTFSTAPDGLAFIEIDKKGKLLKSTVNSFEKSLSKYMPMEDHKLMDGYYLYIHNIVRTNNNTNLVIAEKFKPTLLGLNLGNLVLIEYDKDNVVIQAKEIPKEPGKASGFPRTYFLPAYLTACLANRYGAMDYLYTLKNEDNSVITFSFIEYPNSKKNKNFGQIKYKNGKITTDKVPIKNNENEEAEFTRLFPAKTGYLLEANYYKKKKELSMDFIKLNN